MYKAGYFIYVNSTLVMLFHIPLDTGHPVLLLTGIALRYRAAVQYRYFPGSGKQLADMQQLHQLIEMAKPGKLFQLPANEFLGPPVKTQAFTGFLKQEPDSG